MNGKRGLQVACLVALVSLLAVGFSPAQAAPLTTGNILVSDETTPGRIREFTPAGALVQTFNLPPGLPGDGPPRDLVVDRNGNIQIYNGTFSPVLTALNPATGAVLSNTPFAGWSTVANITYGGITAFGDFVFVTDMATAARARAPAPNPSHRRGPPRPGP